MPLRQQYLYYQLLKHSSGDNSNLLDEAVDTLCSLHISRLAHVSLRLQLGSLSTCAEEVGVLANPEVSQRLVEARSILQRCRQTDTVPQLLFGRALEAAGVAYSMGLFAQKYKPYLESKLYRTQGLRHLLQNHGDQVLQDVALFVAAFAEVFVTHTLAAHATLQGLATLRRAQPEVYKMVSLQMKAKTAETQREIRHLKTVSLSLDDKLPVADSVKQPAAIRGRRAFSMDVHAGLDGSPSLVA